jgi:hypothetical protein
MDNDSLCCVINPVNACWKCSTKLCKTHSNFSVENLYWCEACHDLDEDSFMMMTHYQERIEDAAGSFDDLKSELETIGDHSSRCKTCKAEEYCAALISLVDNVDYNIRKKWNNKTF